MFAYRGGGGETAESRARGGLDAAAVAAMEVDSDSDEEKNKDAAPEPPALEEKDVPLLVFPTPRPAVFFSDDGTLVRFDMRIVPPTVGGIPPQVCKGASAMSEESLVQKIAFSDATFTPGLVASSPMLGLIMSIVVPPKRRPGAPPFVPGPQPTQTRFIGAGNSCFLLNQIKMLCAKGAIPFHDSWNADKLLHVGACYKIHGGRITQENETQLAAFYQRVADAGRVTDATLEEFMAGCEARTLRYIHLIEWYLYTCLVEPHLQTPEQRAALPLECVLTPHVFPALPWPMDDGTRRGVFQEVLDFFQHKQLSVPHTRIRYALIRPDRKDMYKNYVPRDTIVAYMRDLDRDGLIKDEFF